MAMLLFAQAAANPPTEWDFFIQSLISAGAASLSAAATTTLLFGLLCYLAKGLLEHRLAKDIEEHSSLLEVSRNERDVVFRRTDEKVANTLHELYKLLLATYQNVVSYSADVDFASEGTTQEKLVRARDANRKCYDYLLENRPYIPPKLFTTTKGILDSLIAKANEMTSILRQEERGFREGQEEKYDKLYERWSNVSSELNTSISEVFKSYVADIQTRLGVTDIEKK